LIGAIGAYLDYLPTKQKTFQDKFPDALLGNLEDFFVPVFFFLCDDFGFAVANEPVVDGAASLLNAVFSGRLCYGGFGEPQKIR
jgi:hypothetical protein